MGLAEDVYEAGKSKGKESDDEPVKDEDEEGAELGKEMAAEDILSAIDSKDASALARAIAEFFEMCK